MAVKISNTYDMAKCYILVCIMWIWALAFLPFSLTYIGTGEVRGVCRTSNYKFVLSTFITHLYIPLTLIIFFNYKIFKIARRHRKQIAAASIVQYNQGIQAGYPTYEHDQQLAIPASSCRSIEQAGNLTNEKAMQTGRCTIEQNEQMRKAGNPTNEQKKQVMHLASSCNIDQKAPWHRITKELKPLTTFVIVIGVLLCCFIPYSIAVSLEKFVRVSVPVTLYIIFSQLIAINSIINPFIYGIRHKKYRNAYARLLRILCSFLKLAK